MHYKASMQYLFAALHRKLFHLKNVCNWPQIVLKPRIPTYFIISSAFNWHISYDTIQPATTSHLNMKKVRLLLEILLSTFEEPVGDCFLIMDAIFTHFKLFGLCLSCFS
jgi:hypothetical protein